MNSEELVKRLVENFGKDNILIRSEFHIQVRNSKGLNDIWINKFGGLKAKIYGNNKIIESTTLQNIIKKFQSPTEMSNKTHLQLMIETLDLTNVVKCAERIALQVGAIIYTDAGFKSGKARIAAVYINETEIEMKSKVINVTSIGDAEKQAILLGLSMNESVTIYNDNKNVVNALNNNRVLWIPRKENIADAFGNMRDKND